jgi:putative copper resistance protein D
LSLPLRTQGHPYDPSVDVFLIVVHSLAAIVWTGGTVALVFVGVPTVRLLEGEPRARLMRELGHRWRPVGWGALAVLVATGLVIAGRDHAFSGAGTRFQVILGVKCALIVLMLAGTYFHDFVFGPQLAREIREGRVQRTRPTMVRVGWANFALIVTIPVLGVLLTELGR